MLLRPPSSALLRALEGGTVCTRCAKRLSQPRAFNQTTRRLQSAIARDEKVDRAFFWTNALRRSKDGEEEVSQQIAVKDAAGLREADESPSTAAKIASHVPPAEEPPHRRRKRIKAATAVSEVADVPLPPDASSTLSQTAAAAPAKSIRRKISSFLALSKPRLAFLIVLTTSASYSAYPVPALLSTSVTDAPSLSALTFLYLTGGTFVTIASANTLNMLFERAHDAKMSRTKNRPLVRGLVSKRAAVLFAIATGVFGTGILWYGVNPTTALLGAGNLALYAFAYTPLKRIHPVNTWVGAVVGAIPPLMGWCAAASQYSTTTTTADSSTWDAIVAEASELLFTEQAIGGWLLAALLFAWQFPHFFALSHNVRHEYAGAGYKMLTSSNTAMATRVSLRYSLAMFPICAGLAYYDVTDNSFMLTSSAINGWMLKEAVGFWRLGGAEGSARRLFWASVWQLPIVLVLAMVQKKGLVGRVWRGVVGEGDEEEEFWEEDEDG